MILEKKDEHLARDLMNMHHSNLVKFEGLVLQIPGVNYSLRLSEYVKKGSLHDILLDHEKMPAISLQMKLCFVNDIIAGMNYIQKSVIHIHGRLTSKNCLVDSRFQIKISDFETVLTDKFHQREVTQSDSNSFLKQLLWIDPVLVRQSDFGFISNLKKTQFRTFEIPRGSTKQHDVYSFGIILQEMFYREGPYFLGYREPIDIEDKISGIINDTYEPFLADYYYDSIDHQAKDLRVFEL